MLDLDQKAAERAAERAKAARHGARGDVMPIRWKGEEIATLPAELPLDTLEPVRAIASDLALVIRAAMNAQNDDDENALQRDGAQMIVDLLSSNDNLPNDVIVVLTTVSARVLGPDGYAKFVAGRPSYQDVAALAVGCLEWWGVSLGDLFGPSDSPESDGSTSEATSSDGTTPTPEVSGTTPAEPGSSESPTS